MRTTSWREFCALMRGLGPDSVLGSIVQRDKEAGTLRSGKDSGRRMSSNDLSRYLRKKLGTRRAAVVDTPSE